MLATFGCLACRILKSSRCCVATNRLRTPFARYEIVFKSKDKKLVKTTSFYRAHHIIKRIKYFLFFYFLLSNHYHRLALCAAYSIAHKYTNWRRTKDCNNFSQNTLTNLSGFYNSTGTHTVAYKHKMLLRCWRTPNGTFQLSAYSLECGHFCRWAAYALVY